MTRKHNHYFKDVSKLQDVDVYRVLRLFGVTDQALGHAIKKLLVAGGRGAGKDIRQDVQEAIDTLQRWVEIDDEDKGSVPTPVPNAPSVPKAVDIGVFPGLKTVRYKGTVDDYWPVLTCAIKINDGKWVDGIVYRRAKVSPGSIVQYFARDLETFRQKFEEL